MATSVSQIIHVTSWLSPQGGGIPPVVWALAREVQRKGIECLVAGLDDGGVAGATLPAVLGAIRGPRAFGYSPELRRSLPGRVKAGAVLHCHGLWMHPGVIARKLARNTGTPLVISPHGMLEPWALANSKARKRLAAWLFEDRNLRSAACLHALCAAEARHIREYGLRNPIAIVPNGIDLADFPNGPSNAAMMAEKGVRAGKKQLLFLSRIHPKKGLPHLLRSWHRVAPEFKDWMLRVAGFDQLGHEAELKDLTAELNLQDSVTFVGPLHGEAKRRALAEADAFVLPSFSEGFSMAILEAAASQLPVMLTPECNFPELVAAGGAIEVQPEAESCADGLRQLLSLTPEQRLAMGQRGRKLVEESYTWPVIAAQFVEVYAWLLGRAPKPDCVH